MTPDWAAKPTTVPYANFGNPQSFNLYGYVQNNLTTFGDPDGHCPPGDGNCSKVKVEAKVDQKPKVVQNEKIKDINGKVIAKATNNAIKQDFSNNTWSSTDTQTLTLALPGGQSCSATSTRTLTNAVSDGSPSSKYTLTTTQPVVTPNN